MISLAKKTVSFNALALMCLISLGNMSAATESSPQDPKLSDTGEVIGKITDGLQVTINIRTQEAKIGIVNIHISTKNVSADNMEILMTGNGYPYEISTKDEQGEVPQTKLGKSIVNARGITGGSLRIRLLKPGETLDDTITCSRFFDMSLAGAYSVKVTHRVFLVKADKPILVPSAPLKVMVYK